ncbi:MAG: hypothetical protein ABL996_23695, partial [Micropepsaceae bacterium]
MRRFAVLVAACAVVVAVVVFLWLGGENADKRVEAQDPTYSRDPILRLNTRQHTQPILRAGITADGSIVVTASRDATIRVWRTLDMQVVNIIRIPLSVDFATDPSSANLRAVDISLDGSMVAAAGQVRSDGTFKVFVFNTYTGEILRSPLAARGFIADVAFSPDGTL